MSQGNIDEAPGPIGASRAAGGGRPTEEQRAAAAVVLRMIWGVHMSRAVYVVAALGIAELLAGGPMSAARLAQATQTQEPSLYRVLRLLAALGVLTEHEDRSFTLTILGERLRADVPASMRSWAMLVDRGGGMRSFEPIIETVKTGQPGLDIAYGMGLFEFLAAHPDEAQQFQAAMSERTAALAPSVAARHDFSAMRTVADIGGGKGTLLAAILRAHDHLCAASCSTCPRESPTPPRYSRPKASPIGARSSQATSSRASQTARTATSWPTCCTTGMTPLRCGSWKPAAGAAAKDGRVLIVERLIPDDPADAVLVLLSDLTMLVITGGKERTNAEYGQLLADAGMTFASVKQVAPPDGIIEGLAP